MTEPVPSTTEAPPSVVAEAESLGRIEAGWGSPRGIAATPGLDPTSATAALAAAGEAGGAATPPSAAPSQVDADRAVVPVPAPAESSTVPVDKGGRVWPSRLLAAVAGAALTLALYLAVDRSLVDRPPARAEAALPAAAATSASASTSATARLAELEGEVGLLKQQMALALLETALARRLPFETELALAMVAAGTDEALLAVLDRLGPLAAAGVPTRRELLDALPRLAVEIRTASRQPGLIGSATTRMRDLALALGVGALPDASSELVLRHVEDAHRLAQLDAAAAQMRKLPAGMAGLVGPWLEGFAARELAEQALERLRHAVMRNAFARKAA